MWKWEREWPRALAHVRSSTLPHVRSSTLILLILAALLVLAGFLVFGTQAPLHEDEAIYAAWSRIILTDDLFLRHTPVDKPPLFLYVLAGTFASFGISAEAARVLNVLLMLLVVLLTARLSRRPALAALLLVVTPLTPFFAASSFTDPLMIACTLGGWYAARQMKLGLAGILVAGALLTKPTAVLLLPLVAFEVWAQQQRAGIRPFVLGMTIPLALAWAWDVSRLVPSWWQLGRQAYGTLGAPTVTHIAAWVQPALLGLGTGWLAVVVLHRRRTRRILLVAGIVLAWIPVHIVLGFQPWDRYLLPLAPLLAWCAAEGLPAKYLRLLVVGNALLLVVLLVTPAPGLAGRDGRWTGIIEMSSVLYELPNDTPIYHRELGRPLAFYAPETREQLQWVSLREQPPAGAWWAGRHDDAECGEIVWQRGTLAVCRTP